MVRLRAALAIPALTIMFWCAPTLVLGAGMPSSIVPQNCQGDNAATSCGVCDVAQLAQNVLNTAIYIAVFFAAILFAYAGWQTLTSGGDSEKYASGKRVFTNVVLGLVIILAGWIVIDTLMKTLTNGSFGPWNKVCESVLSAFDHFYA